VPRCLKKGASLCQVDLGVGLVGSVLAGSGSDLSEELVVGVEPAALDVVVAPGCPPGPVLSRGARRGRGGGRQRRRADVSGIAVLLGGFSRGSFALVVGASGGSWRIWVIAMMCRQEFELAIPGTGEVVEADHGLLKARLRPMRGLKRLRSARVISAGHAFVQNRRGHYAFGVDIDRRHRLTAIFVELAHAL
jgi:DDE superfamily endonuclease